MAMGRVTWADWEEVLEVELTEMPNVLDEGW